MQLPGMRWVFFDIGYTLINEDEAVEDRIFRIHEVLKDSGRLASPGDVRAALEEAAARFASSPISCAIAMLADSEELREHIRAEVRWRKELEKPYPEANRVLAALSDRYLIGIIANQSSGTEARLERWGLLKFISCCLASAEVGLSKPDLAIFRLAMKRTRCEPEQVVMVGDRIDNDIVPAKSLGWKTIRIRQGISQGQVPMNGEQEPDFEVRRLREVLSILL